MEAFLGMGVKNAKNYAQHLNMLGREISEMPSPEKSARARISSADIAQEDDSHRQFMHQAIIRECELRGLTDKKTRQWIKEWDILNGFIPAH